MKQATLKFCLWGLAGFVCEGDLQARSPFYFILTKNIKNILGDLISYILIDQNDCETLFCNHFKNVTSF